MKQNKTRKRHCSAGEPHSWKNGLFVIIEKLERFSGYFSVR